MQTAGCVNVALDERSGRLLVKYSASNTKLEERWGAWQCSETAGTPHNVTPAVLDDVRRLGTR